MIRVAGVVLGALVLVATAAGQERTSWSLVPPPMVTSVVVEGQRLVATLEAATGNEGSDRLVVELLAPEASGPRIVEAKTLGKAKATTRVVAFVLPSSGTYEVRVQAVRTGNEPKVVVSAPVVYTLPLVPPAVTVRNLGSGILGVSWKPVAEAQGYRVVWTNGDKTETRRVESTEANLELTPGKRYTVVVEALRDTEAVGSTPQARLVTPQADREWNFTWFGQSTKAGLNAFELIEADPLRFRLSSATFLAGSVDQKGGKFTTFHDGISFYYTAIDPQKENFVLTATFTVDQFNPTPDGQEGFGLLVLDSLGQPGVSMTNHYTNSAGLIATKFEAVVDGIKRTSKDTLGSRMVWGITPEVLAQGDSGIAQNGTNVSTAYSYETADLITAGAKYTLTLKKTNTGYHAVYRRAGEAVEHTLYDASKLAALDPDHDYVGFAVARGCNVTVSDVVMTFTDPRNDAPARPEPPALVPLVARLDAPAASGDPQYRLVFRANADGTLRVTSSQGAWEAPVKAGQPWSAPSVLQRGQNDFAVEFDVDPGYAPALASGGRAQIIPATTRFIHTVYHRTYPGAVLFVSPTGSNLGDGTREHPLNLATALAFVGPGQVIELADGTYRPKGPVVVERGNDGAPGRPKVLRAAPGAHPVFDFSFSTGGMVLAGDWWAFEAFALTSTPGNVKGLQIAGSHNVVRAIEASLCGDTGIQISGNSTEPAELWPSHNLVVDCASWGNNDPAQNNADGFAAKLTCGPGNVFRNCLAYNNIDDGWDLFSKIETGPIGAVVIENCVAWGNGRLPDGSGNGDGNGFKLGGNGIAVAHVLRGSLAFANGASGITSNSDPAVVLEFNTSYGNRGANVNLYGKGTGLAFQARGTLSMAGGAADVIPNQDGLASADNYYWNGAQSLNALGHVLGAGAFVHTDAGRPPVWDQGRLDLGGLLVPTDRVPLGVGARLQASSSAR